MKTISLSGADWTFCRADGTGERRPMIVPGSVYAALLADGAMEDPFYRDNELKALPLSDHDYLFEKQFSFPEDPSLYDALLLRFDGLDTLCEVTLNGKVVGRADNMHRVWEMDVSSALRTGDNTLMLLFSSPTRYIAEQQARCETGGTTDAMRGFPHLRKAHCMFGWDWGPRLPDMGVWRDITLLCARQWRINTVHIRQQHSQDAVTLTLQPELEVLGGHSPADIMAQVTAPDGTVYQSRGEDITIPNPALWWPRGYGGQPLYTVTVTLRNADGVLLDSWTRRIGLRTMELSREKDQWGEEFCHKVNGVKIFAMGADYIPEDNLLSRISPERTRRLLEDAAAAHMNCVRVWGGGYYPDDFFYDICDELGLLVWQDFMFACAIIEPSDAMLDNIRGEARDNIIRLRHHASLGLWCGNNEMESAVVDNWYNPTPRQYSGYIRLYEHILPALVKEHDPDAFYWPSSPSCGGGFHDPNNENSGDAHYWDVWHGGKPFTEYRKFHFRYASEFGFQSFPSPKTVESFTAPEDRNIFSYVMEKHQRNNAANGKIMTYLSDTFLYPTDFNTLLYASQLLQAEAIRNGVEHWRRNRGRCMGAVYWQLNDCWPVASWAGVDYYGRWKALHYAAKRFFAPILLSCAEEGVLTGDHNVNAQDFTPDKSVSFCLTNETMSPFRGTMVWALRCNQGSVIRQGTLPVSAPPLSSVAVEGGRLSFPEADHRSQYVSYELLCSDGGRISGGAALFSLPKHFHFQNPHLRAEVKGDTITVYADAYARAVEIDSPDSDFLLEDNYFDLNAGERSVRVLRGTPKTLTLRSVYDIR